MTRLVVLYRRLTAATAAFRTTIPPSRLMTLRVRALTRRLVSQLDVCTVAETDAYYHAIREPVPAPDRLSS